MKKFYCLLDEKHNQMAPQLGNHLFLIYAFFRKFKGIKIGYSWSFIFLLLNKTGIQFVGNTTKIQNP